MDGSKAGVMNYSQKEKTFPDINLGQIILSKLAFIWGWVIGENHGTCMPSHKSGQIRQKKCIQINAVLNERFGRIQHFPEQFIAVP
jgi:hypothetical protein